MIFSPSNFRMEIYDTRDLVETAKQGVFSPLVQFVQESAKKGTHEFALAALAEQDEAFLAEILPLLKHAIEDVIAA